MLQGEETSKNKKHFLKTEERTGLEGKSNEEKLHQPKQEQARKPIWGSPMRGKTWSEKKGVGVRELKSLQVPERHRVEAGCGWKMGWRSI